MWNLDNLFLGGSKSPQFHHHIKQLEIDVTELEEKLNSFNSLLEINGSIGVDSIIKHFAAIQINLSQANSFITCLLAQNTKDQDVITLREVTSSINAQFELIIKKFQSLLLNTSEHLWQNIIDSDALTEHKVVLSEWRKKAEMFLSEQEESLISDLAVDGYHAWRQCYQSLLGSIKIKIQLEEELKELSVGQTINLRSHPNEHIRKTAHDALEDVWQEKTGLFA